MKTENPDVRSMTSEDFETMAMSVDPRTAQIFFRDKMYTADGKLRVIAQEYMANARDAHRETGKSDTAIEITLPTSLDPQFTVRDYGQGISPDRMKNVFRIYGKTTKAGSNLENGGFGIGAKCGFSYANAFAVTTIHQRIKYVYSMYIDDNAMNQIATMYTGPAGDDEPDGTEIKIPIKADDIRRFTQWVHEVTHHWTPRPVFKGREATYREYEAPIDASPGCWSLRRSCFTSYFTDKAGIWVLADDIPYLIPGDDCKACGEVVEKLNEALCALNLAAVLPFKVGELMLYPSREILYYNAATKHAIADRVAKMVAEIVSRLQSKLDAVTSIHEAVGLWWSSSPVVSLATKLEHPKYKGISILSAQKSEDVGIMTTTVNVEPHGPHLCIKRFETEKLVWYKHLFQPSGGGRTYIIDPAGGEIPVKDIKRALRADGRGSAVVVTVTDPEKAKNYVDFAGFVAAGYKPLVNPPKPPRSHGRAEAVFVETTTAYISGDSADGITTSHERSRTYFDELSSLRFFKKRTAEQLDGTVVSYMDCGEFGEKPLKQGLLSYTLLVAMKMGLERLSLRPRCVSLTEWAPRFAKHVPDDEAVFFQDCVDEVRYGINALDAKGLRRLVLGGYHLGDIVKAPRWFWPEESGFDYDSSKAERVRRDVTTVLSLSKRFSTEFVGMVSSYIRIEVGNDCGVFASMRRHTELLDELLGPAIVAKVKSAVDDLHAVRDEFMAMFAVLPELPYLFEALASNTIGDGQRGAPDGQTLIKFISALIADKYTASLRFSHINNPAPVAVEGSQAS